MKTILIFICAGAFIFCGCQKKEAAKTEKSDRYEMLTIKWDREIPEIGFTNHTVTVWLNGKSTDTDVKSLDEAANVLNKYGWEFVSSDVDNGEKNYHLRRVESNDGAKFDLIVRPPGAP